VGDEEGVAGVRKKKNHRQNELSQTIGDYQSAGRPTLKNSRRGGLCRIHYKRKIEGQTLEIRVTGAKGRVRSEKERSEFVLARANQSETFRTGRRGLKTEKVRCQQIRFHVGEIEAGPREENNVGANAKKRKGRPNAQIRLGSGCVNIPRKKD